MKNKKIWIDLDNSPHVPFFFPIIRELERRGCSIFITVRDAFQVCGLADYYGIPCKRIGRHHGANKLLKVLGTIWRAFQLAAVVRAEKPNLSISHGSRSLVITSSMLHIPTVLIFDYEYAEILPFIKPIMGIAPEVINDPHIAKKFKKGIRAYSGLKEDVYVRSFETDDGILKELNLKEGEIIVTIRPPATEAHYHNPEAEKLFYAAVDMLADVQNSRMVILPRNEKVQRELVEKRWPILCQTGKIVMPERVVNGLDLIWHSDLVISGGGTMNREAAALGVPVYSIFRGKIGAVDQYLETNGRLTLLKSIQDVKTKIRIVKRHKSKGYRHEERKVLQQIIDAIFEAMGQL